VTRGFDVLVGADGIWSAVRQQMWGEGPKPGSCMYSGYTLFAAETVMPPDSPFYKSEGYFDVGYKVYIGPGKYFVTSDVGSGRIQWYAFLALPPGTRAKRESDGSILADCSSAQSCVPTTDGAGNAVSCNGDFLRAQFAGWTEEIHACLGNTPESLIEQRDLYDRPPSMSKSWSDGHVTMLGDAVHPVKTAAGEEHSWLHCDLSVVLCR
jgi:zeaxanthin epoxidase